MTADVSLVPPGRLGALLAAERTRQGLTIDEIRASSGLGFSSEDLRDIEHGRLVLSDSQVQRLLAAYNTSSGPLVPQRSALIVDTQHRALMTGSRTRVLPEDASVDEVLDRYLSLLYLMRDLRPGRSLQLRGDDLVVLSRALEHDITDVEQRLFELMLPDEGLRWYERLNHRLTVPAAGIAVGLTGVGALVLIQFPDGTRPVLGVNQATEAVAGGDVSQSVELLSTSAIELAPPELGPATTVERVPVDNQTAAVGAAASALIPLDLDEALPGWSVTYTGPRDGYRGNANTITRTITIHVSPGDDAEDLAHVLAHELGHAIDVMYLDDDQRREWMEMRSIDGVWWPASGKADFHVGAGDFAEAVAAALIGSPSDSDHGAFSSEEIQFVADIVSSLKS